MKHGSTHFLRFVIALLGLAAIAFCVATFPAAASATRLDEYRPVLFGLYLTAIPFLTALYQALKLLGFIDRNKAFSEHSVRVLGNIKWSGIAIALICAAYAPYLFVVADNDDAPGVLAIGLVIMFASSVVATFAAVLQNLIRNAVEIKSENDLTV
jgi:hypothetical protein